MRNLTELRSWPEFHNGVAAGLRLAPVQVITVVFSSYIKGLPFGYCVFYSIYIQFMNMDFHCPLSHSLIMGFWSVQGKISRTWIVYNKPEEPNATHAGILLALGLRGYLRVLIMTDVYQYLSQVSFLTSLYCWPFLHLVFVSIDPHILL